MSSSSLTYLRDEHVVRMGSNNCSNVYVYACTSPAPSSSPSIVVSHFLTSHVKSLSVSTRRKCSVLPPNTDNIVSYSFEAPVSVHLFRIMLITQSKNTSRSIFNAEKKKYLRRDAKKSRCKSEMFSHIFLFGDKYLQFAIAS